MEVDKTYTELSRKQKVDNSYTPLGKLPACIRFEYMLEPGRMKKTVKKPFPVRLSDSVMNDVKHAGEMLGGSKDQEVFRLALEIGLKVLAGVDYDVAGIVARFAISTSGLATATPQSGAPIAQAPVDAAQQALQTRKARSSDSTSASRTKDNVA